MQQPPRNLDLSGRIAYLRQTVFGARGRASFARTLNISPSTYNYYEKGRPAPAELLAKVSAVTGADLTWLLTGEGKPFSETPSKGGDTQLSPFARDALDRFVSSGGPAADSPAAQAALRAILAQVENVLPAGAQDWREAKASLKKGSIPILGRTAAGLLASWDEYFAGRDDPRVFDRLIRQVEGAAVRERGAELKAADAAAESQRPADATAMLIQLSEPTPGGVAEFLELPGLGDLGPGAFALRVDGDSMSPRILDGDIVVCRRGVTPLPGQTAVVCIRNRIGLTVKLWRPEGEFVHLIPINETYPETRVARSDIVWQCRVLWVVRL